MIDVALADLVAGMLDDGRAANQTAIGRHGVAANDQWLAAMVDSCRRLGIPADATTARAYALGVLHAVNAFRRHMVAEPCTATHLRTLSCRAALLADRDGAGGGR